MHEIFTGERMKDKLFDKIQVYKSKNLIIFRELIGGSNENRAALSNIQFICLLPASQKIDYFKIQGFYT